MEERNREGFASFSYFIRRYNAEYCQLDCPTEESARAVHLFLFRRKLEEQGHNLANLDIEITGCSDMKPLSGSPAYRVSATATMKKQDCREPERCGNQVHIDKQCRRMIFQRADSIERGTGFIKHAELFHVVLLCDGSRKYYLGDLEINPQATVRWGNTQMTFEEFFENNRIDK